MDIKKEIEQYASGQIDMQPFIKQYKKALKQAQKEIDTKKRRTEKNKNKSQ